MEVDKGDDWGLKMAAREFEFDTHSMSARVLHSAENSGREASNGSSRAYDEHSGGIEPPMYARRYKGTRGVENSGKRSNSPVQQRESYRSAVPADFSQSKGGRTHSNPDYESGTHSLPPKGSQYAGNVAVDAAQALGRGFDVTSDFRLGFAKGPAGTRLVDIDETNTHDLFAPGNIVIPNVSVDIRCDKGERTHYTSEVLPFAQVLYGFPAQ